MSKCGTQEIRETDLTQSRGVAEERASDGPSYLVLFRHCQERAATRFNMNLSLTTYFNMVNGKVPSVVVGHVQSRKPTGKSRGRCALVQYAGIPGTWVRRGRWVTTCWEGKIG